MEIFATIANRKLVADQYLPIRYILGWLHRWHEIAARLILAFVLLSLGQLAGRTDFHPIEGLTGPTFIGESAELPFVTASARSGAPSAPTIPHHLPQSHILHHTHCQFAPSLTTVLLIPPRLLVLRYVIFTVQLQQRTILPITPPPQIASI